MYEWLTERMWRKLQNRPLSFRKFKGEKGVVHTGRKLVAAYEKVITSYCYEKSKARGWPVRNFLQSEVRNLPPKHAILTNAFSSLGEALKRKEVSTEPRSILDWLCLRAIEEVEAEKRGQTETKFRLLLFFGLTLRDQLEQKPELLVDGHSASGFRPSKCANELLARACGAAAPGRIEALVGGDIDATAPEALALAIRSDAAKEREIVAVKAELQKVRAGAVTKPKGKGGRKKITDRNQGRDAKILRLVEQQLPRARSARHLLRELKGKHPNEP